MVPAVISLPPNAFTPRRWALESRPLRVEPPPLVLDMGSLRSIRAASDRDRGDLDHVVLLAMAVATMVVGAALEGEAVDLRALDLADDLGGDRRALELVRRGEHGASVDHHDGGQRHVAALGGVEQLHSYLLAFGHLFLLAA